MRDAGLPMAFGSDLLGQLHKYQSMEFSLRASVLTNREVLHSATRVSAKLCGMEDEIGVIKPGAYADLLIVDGNPLEDITTLERHDACLTAIMKGGVFHKNSLAE
jgi:imidazolonepropionase-like amidohydrolase